jgi:hypothetical protein
MNKPYYFILAFIFLYMPSSFAQHKKKVRITQNSKSHKSTATSSVTLGNDRYPITRDTLNIFPDSLLVDGEVVDYNIGRPCGIFCGCGAIKIRLTKPNPNYPFDFIFLGIGCMDEFPEKLSTRKTWSLSKIQLNDHSCFWTEDPNSKFDSNGLPFYTTTD